jgi:hypothetical protein
MIMEDYGKRDLFLESIKMLEELKKIREKNQDDRVKDIGDRVIVWDGSYNIDKNTSKHRSGIDILFQNHGIVIQTNCGIKHYEPIIEKTVILDLLIKFETGEEVYTSSEMVKRIDDNTL